MTEKGKMLAGQMYDPLDEELVRMRLKARKLTGEFNMVPADRMKQREALIRRLFGATGENFLVEPTFQCDYGCNIYVGNNFFMNFNCVILDVAEVRIGENCMISPQVGIYTATHPVEAEERISGREYAKPVSIGHNCWIGGHATINPGVSLGDNVVVASGAVVTRSFGSSVVIGGNPARVITRC